MSKSIWQAATWAQRFQVTWSLLHGAFFKIYIWPLLSAVLTGATGILGGVPLMWVFVAVAIVFMAVTTSYLRVSEIYERMNPLNKLAYVNTVIHMDLKGSKQIVVKPGGSTGKPRKLEKMQLGVELQNRSPFPISLFLAMAETEIEQRKPPRGTFPKAAVTVLPGALMRLLDDPIDLDGVLAGRLVGKMNLKIRYGMKGDEDSELHFDAVVDIVLQPNGTLSQIGTNWMPNVSLQPHSS